MSAEYQGQDPIKLATQAEQDLNSYAAKQGKTSSDSSKSFRDQDRNLHQDIETMIPARPSAISDNMLTSLSQPSSLVLMRASPTSSLVPT